MRGLALALFLSAAITVPAMAQSDEAGTASAAKGKRVCRFIDNGNPMHPERRCHTVMPPKSEGPAASPAASATPVADATAPASAQVAQTTPHG